MDERWTPACSKLDDVESLAITQRFLPWLLEEVV